MNNGCKGHSTDEKRDEDGTFHIEAGVRIGSSEDNGMTEPRTPEGIGGKGGIFTFFRRTGT
jgi:hypothetical protein